jgi:hypothetical protein
MSKKSKNAKKNTTKEDLDETFVEEVINKANAVLSSEVRSTNDIKEHLTSVFSHGNKTNCFFWYQSIFHSLRTKTLGYLCNKYCKTTPRMKEERINQLMCYVKQVTSPYDKRRIEQENIQNTRSGQHVNGVYFGEVYLPNEILAVIMRFLKKSRRVLDQVGLVNSTFYLGVISTWDRVKIPSLGKGIYNIPLLVLQSATIVKVNVKKTDKITHIKYVLDNIVKGCTILHVEGTPKRFFDALNKNTHKTFSLKRCVKVVVSKDEHINKIDYLREAKLPNVRILDFWCKIFYYFDVEHDGFYSKLEWLFLTKYNDRGMGWSKSVMSWPLDWLKNWRIVPEFVFLREVNPITFDEYSVVSTIPKKRGFLEDLMYFKKAVCLYG